VDQLHPMAQRLRHAAPVMRRATGFHQPLDRLGLLLYISPKRHSAQPLALLHLTGTDTLGNLVNGLGQIHCDTLHLRPSQRSSPAYGAGKCGARRAHYSTQSAHFVRWDRRSRPLSLIVKTHNIFLTKIEATFFHSPKDVAIEIIWIRHNSLEC
jgi:hypothetical protein